MKINPKILIAEVVINCQPRLRQVLKELRDDVDDWFCRTREVAMASEEYKGYLPVVVLHMARKYSGTKYYNAWYSWHHCHDIGVLKNGLPVSNCLKVSAESERLVDVIRSGGIKALKAYIEAVK